MEATWTNSDLVACLRPDTSHTIVNIGISLKPESFSPGDTFNIVYNIDNDTDRTEQFNTLNASFNIDVNNYSTSQVHYLRILRMLHGQNGGCVENYKWQPPTLALNVHNSPVVDIGPNVAICEGEPFEFTTTKQGFTYDSVIWNDTLRADSYSGTASITDTVRVVVYKNKCESSTQVLLTVHQLPRFQITNNGETFTYVDTATKKTIKKDTMLCGDEVLALEAGNLKGNFVGASYEWATKEISQTINFNALSPNDDSIRYHLWSKVTSKYGCSFSDTITIIRCIPPSKKIIATAITPNGDGENDTWIIPYLQYYPDAVVDVYDRWGRIVFHSDKGYQKPWDGKANGKDLPMDNYYYIIQLDKKSKPIVGNITILR
jgi:gliding motility-associated-like protein